MPIFLGWLIVLAISTAINALLKPRIKRQRAPDLELPKADEGVPIPLGYGTFAVTPNVVWTGNITQTPSPVGSTYYAGNMVMTLALGSIDELVDIRIGGKSLRFEPVTANQGGTAGAEQVIVPSLPYVRTGDADTPTTFSIQAAQMFGGREREGGIRGTMRLYWGGLNQPADEITTAYMVAAGLSGGTGRPGVCYVVFAFEAAHSFYWGTVPQIKDIVFLLRHSPSALGVGMLGQGANPAEIIYDLKFNELRGLGLSQTLGDFENYTDVAETLFDEGLDLSPVFTQQDEVEDEIDDVLKHTFGVMRVAPVTGKYQLKLARNDYTTLQRVTTSLKGASYGNARNLQLSRPGSRETTNDITLTYRRFYTSEIGGVTGKVISDHLHYNAVTVTFLNVHATNISLVTLYANGVVITQGYIYDPESGIVTLSINSGAVEGDRITIDYTAGPVFNGYKEATARWQDLASIQQGCGEIRPFAADYPFFTSDLNAGMHAARLGQQMSRSLWGASWEMDRSGFGLAQGDVVAVYYAPLDENGNEVVILDDVAFRVTEMNYGLLEDGVITVHAIEDVFAQDVVPMLPQGSSGSGTGGGGGVLVAPSIAIGQAPNSAITVCLFASDPNFQIELQRATDSLGTGMVTLSSVLPGTTTCGTDPQTTGQTRYYRARLVPTTSQIGYTVGDWTAWVAMTAGSGVSGDCVALIPAFLETTTESGGVATLTLSATDPQTRIVSVEFQAQADNGAFSDWLLATSALQESGVAITESGIALFEPQTSPYSTSVTYVTSATIRRRVTYLASDGTQVESERTFTYPRTYQSVVELGVMIYEGTESVIQYT